MQGVIKVRKKKFLIIALAVVTVVWAVALYLHVQSYNRYVQELIERYAALGIPPGLVDPHPILGWQFGGYLVISGIAIFIAWSIAAILKGEEKK